MLLRLQTCGRSLCGKYSIFRLQERVVRTELMTRSGMFTKSSVITNCRTISTSSVQLSLRKRFHPRNMDRIPKTYEPVYSFEVYWMPYVLWPIFYGSGINALYSLMKFIFQSPLPYGSYVNHHWDYLTITVICTAQLLFAGAILRRLPVRIFYNDDKREFIAVTYSLKPMQTENIHIRTGEIHPEPIQLPGVQGFEWCIHNKTRRKLFVLKESFRTPKYSRIFFYGTRFDDY